MLSCLDDFHETDWAKGQNISSLGWCLRSPRPLPLPPPIPNRAKGDMLLHMLLPKTGACMMLRFLSSLFLKNKSMYFTHKHRGSEQLPDYITSIPTLCGPVHHWVYQSSLPKVSQYYICGKYSTAWLQDSWSSAPFMKAGFLLALKFINTHLKTYFTLTYFDSAEHYTY